MHAHGRGRRRRHGGGGRTQRAGAAPRARAAARVPRRARDRQRRHRGDAARRRTLERHLPARRDGAEVVLRRPPRPPWPPSAHDVLREARLLRALAPAGVRVPEVLAVSEGEAVIGAPFYVMERLEGPVVTDDLPTALDTPEERARMTEGLLHGLVEIHAVDPAAPGLDGFGRPTGYLERQLRRWRGSGSTTRRASSRTSTPPAPGSRTICPSRRRRPSCTATTGSATSCSPRRRPTRLVGVFDWEMATIGDPLSDLGYLLMTWSEPDDPAWRFELAPVTRREGFPSRGEIVARYESSAAAPCPTCGRTSSSRSGRRRCSWRATTAARSRGAPTIPTSRGSATASSSWRGARGSSRKRG